jgi:predicted acyl esterase
MLGSNVLLQEKEHDMVSSSRFAASLVLVGSLACAAPAVAQETAGAMGQGTEGRMWVEAPLGDPTSPQRYDVEIVEHAKITMRDGVKLDGVLYLPKVPKPGPCILVADGYGWRFDRRDRRFAERGYAVANFSYRGIDESEGDAGLYDHFGEDGYDMVEWMAKQPWCDGNVGMFGSSLPGIPLWLIAHEAPPSLKAIAPDVACGDCYEYLWYPGGMLPGPGRESRERHEYVAAIQHRDFDEWWQDQAITGAEYETIAKAGIPILASGGWRDYITPGNIQAYREFIAAGGTGRLLVSPGGHGDARRAVIGPYHHEQHMDLFFDHYLRGEKNQWTDGTYKGDVVIWVEGPNRYRFEKTWPIPDTRAATLYFRAAPSGSIKSLNDGSLSAAAPAASETAVSYDYFPEIGPFLKAMRGGGEGVPMVDQKEYEAEALTWTTEPLAAATEITGAIDFSFSAASSAADTDFVLMVTDVAPDGRSQFVTAGFLNGPRYPDRTNPRPLVPGEIKQYRLTTQSLAHVFPAGHRIRFSLAGGAEGAPGQGGLQGPGKNAHFSHVTVYQDAAHPASVTLPVIGTARLPTETAASGNQ